MGKTEIRKEARIRTLTFHCLRLELVVLFHQFSGSTEHVSVSFSSNAATEDATRAIELKNGSSVGGRKIGVKHCDDAVETKNDTDGFTSTVDGHGSRMPKLEKPVQPRKVAALCADLADKENCSEKQRVTRTVIFGGLRNTEMAEAVHRCAKESGMVCAVTYPLPKEELDQHGLAQDGCKMDASVVLFTSVKLAHVAGAKTQKWKLIIRNLPFKAKLNEIKDMFSVAGLSKGFAIVKFTRKQDAENAIQKFNWKMFGKRPIAVHWAVPKRLHSGGTNAAVASDDEDNDTRLEISGKIKFLKTVKKGKVVIKNQSRGVAFDQFSEHQHALGALRVLNNNPEMFGPKHRPIVEFAVDNVQTLKLRKAKLQAQQQDANDKRTRKHSEFKKSKMEDTVGEGEANKKPKLNPAGEKTKPSPSKENSEGSNRNSKGSNRKSKNCKTDPKPVVGSSDNVETNVNDTHKLKSKKVEATLLEDQEKNIKSYPPLKCSRWSSTPRDGNKTGNIDRYGIAKGNSEGPPEKVEKPHRSQLTQLQFLDYGG
ncbi:hypothetical protein GOBAR_DD03845 [Gossypium barbadense]|nr:hypothetical protein GOBAR_DD03845 [Gossypium barbadense]